MTQPPRPTWNHPLLGADTRTLLGLFMRHRIGPRLWPHALILLGAALARAPLGLVERTIRAGRSPRIEAPVFILGHWRSGTTHLYNLLSRDPQFAWPDPIATGLPWNFLLLGRALRPLLERALPDSRLIDNVAVDPDSPQEDEIALASMQTLSYYHALFFPEAFATHFRQGLFPETEGVAAARLDRRRRRVLHYFGKLLGAGRGATLLVKNPAWTGQVRWLCELFPDARFIHIHRNPHVVFESTRNFYRKLLPAYALQPFDAEAVEPLILEAWPRMIERLDADTAGLPAQRFIEIAYADLESAPLDCLRAIYRQLGLGDFAAIAPTVEDYLAGLAGYRKNPHRFTEHGIEAVERAWGGLVRRWGYDRPEAESRPSETL